MEHSFGVKFGYLRWRRHLQTGEPPSFAEIGRAIGRTGPAVSAWAKAQDAPTDYRLQEPMAEYFGEAEADWLIKGSGAAPDPELWAIWLRYRRADVRPASAKHVISRANAAEQKATATSKKRARGA